MRYIIVCSAAAVMPLHAATIYAGNAGANNISAYDDVSGAFLGVKVASGDEVQGQGGIRVGPDGSFYVVSQGTPGVVRYSSSGSLLSIFDPGNTAGLDSPQDLMFGPDR